MPQRGQGRRRKLRLRMLTLGLGRSSTRVIPSLGSGRYSPGPGMAKLLEEGSYQEVRPRVAKCSLIWPDFLAIDSKTPGVSGIIEAGTRPHSSELRRLSSDCHYPQEHPKTQRQEPTGTHPEEAPRTPAEPPQAHRE